jgi:hypothetical protein
VWLLTGDRIAWVLGVFALLGALAGFTRWLVRKAWPRWRGLVNDFVEIRATLIGHGAVAHPITGEELAPAEPGVGVQVARLRDQLREEQSEIRSQIEFVIGKLHALEHEVKPNGGSSLKDGLNRVEERLRIGDTQFAGMAAELGELRKSLGTLAEAQPQLWAAIEAVAKAQPPADLGMEQADL